MEQVIKYFTEDWNSQVPSFQICIPTQQNVGMRLILRFIPCMFPSPSTPPPLLTLGPQPYQYQSKEDGWYEGVLKGRRGLFPGNYVQISGSEDPYMHTRVTTLTLCILTINLSESKGKAMMLLPTQWHPYSPVNTRACPLLTHGSLEQVFHSPWQYVFSVT